jgi:hypothetical protein
VRFGAALGAALLVATLSLSSSSLAPAYGEDDTVTIEDVVRAEQPKPLAAPEPEVALSPPAPVPIAAPPTLDAISYYVLRTADPKTLIRYFFAGTGDVGLMLAIASRESGFNCGIDNRAGSSATGLFQTMGFHRALAESLVIPGTQIHLTWANVSGPDCLDDVILAKQLYNGGKGLRNWSPLPRPWPGED